MRSAVYVDGPINDPAVLDRFWSVEVAILQHCLIEQVAFPIDALSLNNTNHVPPRVGEYAVYTGILICTAIGAWTLAVWNGTSKSSTTPTSRS